MPITKLHPTFTFDEDRLAQLRAVVPEAFADGRINWETLRAALGEHLEDDEADAEHFGLFWPGKRAARRLASQPSRGTLVPQPGLGVNEATTRHLFIEGDNLEVLKLLLKSYAGQVKLIYIDPPYNTGNDFIYSDDFTEPLEAYLRRTGQMDEEGQALTTNPKASGRFHSNWLNMMYPRLLLARQLLSSDGVIFVSIDDNEVHNLRQLMDEVFGEENFIGVFVWKSRHNVDSRNKTGYSKDHEYVLAYGAGIQGRFIDESKYSNPDNDPRGPWMSDNLVGLASIEKRPNLHYSLVNPETGINYGCPPKGWRYNRETMNVLISEGKIIWPSNPEGRPRRKKFISELQSHFTGLSSLLTEVPTTSVGTQEVRAIFNADIFDFPKPLDLIKSLIEQAATSDDIVLDFFAGSCPIAEAVFEINSEGNTNLQFIAVQLPEPTKAGSPARLAGYSTIADIGRERIRRVIARMQAEAAGQETTDDGRPAPDLGFRSYRLARSHFKAWQDYTGEQAAELETLFTQFESPLVESWEPSALLTELLLLEGFPLDSRVRPLPAFTANTLLEVSSDFCAHRLTVCLDARLHPETLAALDLRAEDTFICLESALDDEAKLRLADRCNLKVV
ncbi:MAG TPA: site-specific DNA-methyltransferase [bacterium]|nr:site-specific DNA-methyltransferase [bacterium]